MVETIPMNKSVIFLFSFKNSFYNIIIIQFLEKVNNFFKKFFDIYVTDLKIETVEMRLRMRQNKKGISFEIPLIYLDV